MALQVRELAQLISHKLDADEMMGMSAIAIVNEAGRFLVSLAPWSFQLRAPATLGMTNGQGYLVLPTDFGRIAGAPTAHPDGAIARQVRMTTLESITQLRGNPSSIGLSASFYYGALAHPAPGGSGGAPTPRIEIAPEPTSTDPSGFLMAYYARWDERTSDEQYVNLPEYAEGLMRHLCRETAAGYENDAEKSVWDRVGEIKRSDIYAAVMEASASEQMNLGQQPGGAVARSAVVRAATSGGGGFGGGKEFLPD